MVKMIVRLAKLADKEKVSGLIAQYRVELKQFKGITTSPNLEQAKEEFEEYLDSQFPIFVAEGGDKELLGYLVCRINNNVVWVESIFVTSSARGNGVATVLYKEAESVATELGNYTVYNWVHPNNDGMIAFLSKMGYNVLNLIEIRKPLRGETPTQKIRVGNHEYSY